MKRGSHKAVIQDTNTVKKKIWPVKNLVLISFLLRTENLGLLSVKVLIGNFIHSISCNDPLMLKMAGRLLKFSNDPCTCESNTRSFI